MDIITYCYFKWTKEDATAFDGMQVERFTSAYHRLEDNGMIDCVQFAGQINCSCRWTDPFGPHYGFLIIGSKEQTIKMLKVIDCDAHESFELETMEKLDKEFRTSEMYFMEQLAAM